MARRLSNTRGQMAVELAALMPVIIVVTLVVYNLGRFVALCATFDRVSLDACVAQGVAPGGAQTELVAVDAVRSTLEASMSSPDTCSVEVHAESVGSGGQPGGLSLLPSLTRYTCTLVFRPWPSAFTIAGVRYGAPVVLRHERVFVVDRYRPGVVM